MKCPLPPPPTPPPSPCQTPLPPDPLCRDDKEDKEESTTLPAGKGLRTAVALSTASSWRKQRRPTKLFFVCSQIRAFCQISISNFEFHPLYHFTQNVLNTPRGTETWDVWSFPRVLLPTCLTAYTNTETSQFLEASKFWVYFLCTVQRYKQFKPERFHVRLHSWCFLQKFPNLTKHRDVPRHTGENPRVLDDFPSGTQPRFVPIARSTPADPFTPECEFLWKPTTNLDKASSRRT